MAAAMIATAVHMAVAPTVGVRAAAAQAARAGATSRRSGGPSWWGSDAPSRDAAAA
nr:hypothetical protein [Actinacidiphila paucisporea]